MTVLMTGLMMALTSASALGDTPTTATGLVKPSDSQLGFLSLLGLIAQVGEAHKKSAVPAPVNEPQAREERHEYIKDLAGSDLGSEDVGGYEGVTADGAGYSAVAKTQ